MTVEQVHARDAYLGLSFAIETSSGRRLFFSGTVSKHKKGTEERRYAISENESLQGLLLEGGILMGIENSKT